MSPLFTQRRTGGGQELPPLRERLEAMRLVPRFLLLVWKTKPLYAAAVVGVRLVRALGPVVLLWIAKLIIDGVIANLGAAEPDWRTLFGLVVLECIVALLLELLTRVSGLVEGLLADLFTIEMSVRLMRHAGTLDLEHFEDPDFYDSLERARRQTTGRLVLLVKLLNIGQRLVTLASLMVAILAYNVWLAAMLVLAIIPSFLGETHYAAAAYALMFRLTPERRELDYLRYAAASDATAKEVKLFGLTDHFVDRYAHLAAKEFRENRDLSVRRAATGVVLGGLSTLAYYGAVAYMVTQAVAGAITVGALTFLMGSFSRSRTLISDVLVQSAGIYESCLFLGDLFGFLDIEPRLARPSDPRPIPRPIRSGFAFEEVGFRYPERASWALRHVSFALRPGERVALVGENGAGKTTIVKLLTGLYQPHEGRILLDGVDLRAYDPDDLRSQLGVIFQDFVRYDLVARENIAVGRIDLLHDDERILEASRRSLANQVLDNLDGGLDRMLGRRFAGGAKLSGGEWQKIALARAYLREAQLLILDEPTAALDAAAEYEVFCRFSELTADRMAVLISHRFSTVRMADRIVVLQDGRVLEDGDHDHLLTLGGHYAELFSLQAAAYR